MRSLLAHWCNKSFEISNELLFEVTVATFVGFVDRRQLLLTLEQSVDGVHVFWAVSFGVSQNTHDRPLNFFGSTKKWDRITTTLAHFLAVRARHHADTFEDHFFGFFKKLSVVCSVKFADRFARVLEVLALVLAHRHNINIVECNVGRLQHWVGKEASVGLKAFSHLVFIGVREL